jgi:hypothetical protein
MGQVVAATTLSSTISSMMEAGLLWATAAAVPAE